MVPGVGGRDEGRVGRVGWGVGGAERNGVVGVEGNDYGPELAQPRCLSHGTISPSPRGSVSVRTVLPLSSSVQPAASATQRSNGVSSPVCEHTHFCVSLFCFLRFVRCVDGQFLSLSDPLSI